MKDRMSHSINLNGEWRLRAIGESPKAAELSNSVVGANVPGTVHTDLIANETHLISKPSGPITSRTSLPSTR